MSVIAICGLPGSGKTLFATYLGIKSYKKSNFLKKNKECKLFSNYPILINKNKNIYSNKVSLWDFDVYLKWLYHSVVILDEIQLYFDSLEFKNFPKKIRNNFQLHRHFGIDNIYILSQHPSRIVKQLRVLACEFYDITLFFKIPFTPFCFLRYNIYYNYEDFGKSVRVKPDDVPYKFKKKFAIFNYKKIYKSYNTCYMYGIVRDKEYVNVDSFKDKTMTTNEIKDTFNFTDIQGFYSGFATLKAHKNYMGYVYIM